MYQKLIRLAQTNPLKILYLVLAILTLKEVIYVTTFINKVSPIADGFSEANTIRGATFLHEQGFWKYHGLHDICYSDILADKGAKGSDTTEKKCGGDAYTHYPPGPEYMAWLGFNIVGVRNFNMLRLLPILLSVLIGIFFLRTTFKMVGGGQKGLIFGFLLLLPPMYSNYFHGLHHQQYAFIMLQLQMCLSYLYMTDQKWKKWYILLAFAGLGFFQGWMTFDYAFLATLFVVPFYLFLKDDHGVKFSNLVIIGLSSGLSYTLAHLLHFYQVVLYHGDFHTALKDFTHSAEYRFNNAANADHVSLKKYDSQKIGAFTVAKDFLYRVAGRGKYLSINLINFIWIIFGLKFVKRINFVKNYSFEFTIKNSDLMALISAIVISSLWALVMKQHAHIHGFIARHYYFCYFFCCWILISRTKRV